MKIKKNVSSICFLKEIRDKRLYCYGGGKVFEDFLRLYSEINVYAVVDKNSIGLKKNNKNLRFIDINQFCNECDNESVLLITCLDYIEIIKGLQEITAFNELPCYVYHLLRDNNSINESTDNVNKYQLTEFRFQDCMATQKAPSDVMRIALNLGYNILFLDRGTIKHGAEQTEQAWNSVVENININSNLIIQFPLVDNTNGIYKIKKIKRDKNLKIIAIIHDIDVMRGSPTKSDFLQYKILHEISDVYIVHNKNMKNILCKNGFDINKMVDLKIFDYLISEDPKIQEDNGIIIAGNFDKSKASYVYQLNKIYNVKFNLFGANFNDRVKYDNISYYGEFLPDELIKSLKGRYGLVWDGDSLETCSGGKGEYLRINNPHKLSLYIAVGLPVIIWEEAAEADFVLRAGVGLTINSLYDLPDKLESVSDIEYKTMKQNALIVGNHLRNGDYMKNAIVQAEKIIKDIRKTDK